MRTANRMARFQPEFGFQRSQEAFKVRQAESIGLMDDVGQFRIDQCREYDGAHAIGFALGIDPGQRILGLFDAVEKGNPDLPEFDFLELGQKTVTKGLGGQAGAVGNEKYGAFEHHWKLS